MCVNTIYKVTSLETCIVAKISASFLFQILIIELGKHSLIIFIVYLHRHSVTDLGFFKTHQLYKILIEG